MSSIYRNRIWVILFAWVMLVIPLGVINAQAAQDLPVSNQALKNVPTPFPGEDGAAYDARVYAARFGVSAKEAKRRFALQAAAGNLDAQLSAKESATFAGLWLEHTPTFKVIVQFTGAAKPNIATYTQNKELAAIVEIRTAKVSLVDLEKAQAKAFSSFSGTGIRIEAGINVQKNHVELYTLAQDRPSMAAKMDTTQMPAFVDLVTVPSLSQPVSEWFGGLTIRGANGKCTTGFSVKNTSGVKGVITAGHCDNTMFDTFTGTGLPLIFKGEKYGGNYEVQWHTLAGYTPVNKIQWWKGSSSTRVITAATGRSNQAINAYVCKYGITTYYSCGFIADKNYLLTYPDQWKPPVPFTATFIRVTSGNTNPLATEGDSGGPWYIGNTAYGITLSGFNTNAVYMAINYVSGLNVSVLTAP